MIPYYERFVKKYPTMEELAEADENELLKMWEGLGYYSRVRNFQKGVREVVERYGGKFLIHERNFNFKRSRTVHCRRGT